MSYAFERGDGCWLRDEISGCEYAEKSYRHVHCPCVGCNGRATDRSTELRHWREAKTLAISTNFSIDTEEIETDEYGSDSMSVHVGESDDIDQLLVEENNGINTDLEQQANEEEQNLWASNGQSVHALENNSNNEHNPMKKLVVKAVLNALKIKHDSGVSVKTFEDVLEYGKSMLFTSI